MTNKERLISLLGFALDTNAIDGALTDAGITGSDTYTADDSVGLKTLAISIMELLLTTPDTTNENGYAIKYDRDAVLRRIGILQEELGLAAGPVITAPKVW